MSEQPIRVIVISDYQIVRAGLTALIHTHPSRAVVVEVSQADGHLGRHDVAVYDLAGLTVGSRGLEQLTCRVAVVGLARFDHPRLTQCARALGVRDVVAEDVTSGELLTALERAA